MPLTVQQLNADTTFLLTVSSPTTASANDDEPHTSDFTILIDPWLVGPSPIFHAYFAVSSHTTESSIQSLTELSKPPDLIIVSQPKNDHCNKETLCTLPKDWPGTIVAIPAAAKKIRSWKHFLDNQIQAIPAYNPKDDNTCIKLPLGAVSGTNGQGEISIAYIPEPYDLSAVHNAIGITYHSPSCGSAKPFSILYTPHGLTPSLLELYLAHHLRPAGAYPIDLLFHSLNIEANPKLMGGVVSNGAPGGIPIAKMLEAKTWIGAHDEVKENGGIATKFIKCTTFGVEEVEKMLKQEGVEATRVCCLGVGEGTVVGGEG